MVVATVVAKHLLGRAVGFVLGCSNIGKSTLVNALLGSSSSLAKVSATPSANQYNILKDLLHCWSMHCCVAAAAAVA